MSIDLSIIWELKYKKILKYFPPRCGGSLPTHCDGKWSVLICDMYFVVSKILKRVVFLQRHATWEEYVNVAIYLEWLLPDITNFFIKYSSESGKESVVFIFLLFIYPYRRHRQLQIGWTGMRWKWANGWCFQGCTIFSAPTPLPFTSSEIN